MISKKVAEELLKQVNREFLSERLYIAMEYYFKSLDLNGYARLFNDYALEERNHAYKMLEFLDEHNCSTTISGIEDVLTSYTSPKDVFEKAYAHEIQVTKWITDIYKLAIKEGDIASQQFLDWYIEEQREEEDKMLERLNRLKLAGDNMAAILFLEKEDGK
jgi:ferritin